MTTTATEEMVRDLPVGATVIYGPHRWTRRDNETFEHHLGYRLSADTLAAIAMGGNLRVEVPVEKPADPEPVTQPAATTPSVNASVDLAAQLAAWEERVTAALMGWVVSNANGISLTAGQRLVRDLRHAGITLPITIDDSQSD